MKSIKRNEEPNRGQESFIIEKVQLEMTRGSLQHKIGVELRQMTGRSSGEMLFLEIEEVDLQSRTVSIKGKGKMIHRVPISESLNLLAGRFLS